MSSTIALCALDTFHGMEALELYSEKKLGLI